MAIVERSTNPADADLIVVGASARAAAFSCLRAGRRPIACDLFGDRDLRALVPTVRVDSDDPAAPAWPGGLLRALEGLPRRPLVYAGGLENAPEVVDAIAADRELWGNPGAALRRARDPRSMRKIACASGLESPAIATSGTAAPRGDRWLSKPLRGAGGLGIREATPQETAGGPEPERYLQRLVAGTPIAAVFVAGRSSTALVGLTRQLVGDAELGARPWFYCGSVGPLQPSGDARSRLARAGSAFANAFGLRGLFGLDLVVDAHDAMHVIELNPRYTASVEVLEEALDVALMDSHIRACRDGELGGEDGPLRIRHHVAKVIAFAVDDLVVGDLAATLAHTAPDGVRLADIPAPGEHIAAGAPIATLLCAAADPDDALARARAAARLLQTVR